MFFYVNKRQQSKKSLLVKISQNYKKAQAWLNFLEVLKGLGPSVECEKLFAMPRLASL